MMLEKDRLTKISKFMSYVLRHKPEKIGLKLSKDGWANVKELMEKSKNEILFDFNELKQVVQNDDKGRFQFDESFCLIRCVQGHSTGHTELTFKKTVPPVKLYHGTAEHNIISILKTGLNKGKRHHVHLSNDVTESKKVANRRKGKKVILEINSKKMYEDDVVFFISENKVYLSDFVHPKYIKIIETYT